MNVERLQIPQIVRKAVLIGLPLYATLGACSDNADNELPKPTLTPLSDNFTIADLKERAKELNTGLVIVNVSNYTPDLDIQVKLEYSDETKEIGNENVVNLNAVTDKNGNTLVVTGVLDAPDCQGEYVLSLSNDRGQTFKTIQSLQADNVLRKEFLLDEDCTKEFYLTNMR